MASVDFGALNYAHTMRWVIPGVMLTALGFQTIFSAFSGACWGCGVGEASRARSMTIQTAFLVLILALLLGRFITVPRFTLGATRVLSSRNGFHW